MEENILCIDKPEGMTSFDVIRVLRRKLQTTKIGHAGTLDPLASGLLIIGVGPGTKQLSDYIGLPKTYVAQILLGRQTTTADREGEVCAEQDVSHLTDTEIQTAVYQLKGVHTYQVPRYSAVKIDGKPLYKYARAGESVVVPSRSMEVHEVMIEEMTRYENTISVRVVLTVASGVYIRSLAEAVGTHLGVPAMLYALRRTQVGQWHIVDTKRLEDITR